MREPHSEGVANHADLESCAGCGDTAGEALTEALAGRLWSREILSFGRRPCGQKGKATSHVASSRAAHEPGAVVGTRARQETLRARTGRPRQCSVACERQAGGGRRKPYAPRVRCRGVGRGRSTCEGSEPGRATVGGGSGGKGPDQGERSSGCTVRTQWRALRVTETGGRSEGMSRCGVLAAIIRGRSRMS